MDKMVDTSAETWSKTGVAVVKVHENEGVNKKHLLLLAFLTQAKDGAVQIFMTYEIKGKYHVKKNE